MKRYKPLFEEIQANQIAKDLIKAGYKKAGIKRINFQNIPFGDYEVRQLKIYGLNVITVLPKNGADIEKMKDVLQKYNPEIKNGYIVIKR